MAKPDYMCANSFKGMNNCNVNCDPNFPDMDLFNLCAYDRKHHIGLAFASTDQKSAALFSAPPPPQSVVDANLQALSTGRGLRIGSPYSQVLALYGGPVKHGSHFVTSYSANDITQFEGKPAKQPERITLVIDNGRVSSIFMNIELLET